MRTNWADNRWLSIRPAKLLDTPGAVAVCFATEALLVVAGPAERRAAEPIPEDAWTTA
jgi:hypothetical protein